MPLTKISAPEHLSSQRVRDLAAAVQSALVQTCNVPVDDLFQLIQRFKAEEMIIHPEFGGVKRSADACIIEIVYLQERSDQQKRALYQHTVEQALQAGWRADDIMIALIENSKIDWSLGRGQAYLDVCLAKT